MYDLGIINGRVYRNGKILYTNVYIKNGVIRLFDREFHNATQIYDANNHLVLPGLIDPHVHFDLDLGFIHSRDDFDSGTRMAAYGGVTTIIDFLDPVNTPSDMKQALKKRLDEASKSHVDYMFHATLKNPKDKVLELVNSIQELGLRSVKIFTTYSDSSRRTYDKEIKELLQATKKNNIVVLAHIENDDMITLNNDYSYNDLLLSRPSLSETLEVLKLAELTKQINATLYMVHLSSGNTIKALMEQYSDIINKHFFIESCPHYFVFTNNDVQQPNGYLYTLAPPLRTRKEQALLHRHIDNIYTIGTDHCAFNTIDKRKDRLIDIPLGIGGIEHSFDMMFQLFGLKAVDKMSKHVAKVYQLYPKKGTLDVGSDADLFIYNEEQSRIKTFHGNTDYSLYIGQSRSGNVVSTISNGSFVIKDGKFLSNTGSYLGGKS